jgi:NTP pyrophosphatase (non-canonical NTP hydrolase)
MHDFSERPWLTFNALTAANASRGQRWHKTGISEWTVSDWAVAMAGEAGEACNAVKKLRRVEDELPNISEPGRQLSTREAAIAKVAEELADTVIYIDLLAQRLNINLPAAIIEKFNATSEKYGFPERLA